MTNGEYPDEETTLSVDDDDYEDDASTEPTDASAETGSSAAEPNENVGVEGVEEKEKEEPQTHPQPSSKAESESHTYGANSQQLTDERRAAVAEDTSSESDSTSSTESSDSVGLLEGGLTKHELIAFVGGFIASYALAAIFYWGIIISGGFSDVPTAMWVLLAVVVLAPLALMFGLRETSSIAGTLLNRGSR